MDSEDGEFFVKQLAGFVRTHEKALANALQVKRQGAPRHGHSQSVSSASSLPPAALPERPATSASASAAGSLASAFSLGALKFASAGVKSARLALTPHHLFYLLSRFEELAIPVGPMKIRLENLHDSSSAANYVSFLGNSTQRSRTRDADAGSVHSVSSVRSVMSGMSALWASFGIGASISAARTERHKAALQTDLKYLYSAFTKIPCLRLAPDRRARMIKGYEEFPFDSAVPLYVFKNVQALEVSCIDFRQFFGWDRMSDQLRFLTLRGAGVDDPADILVDIVLDDMDKRRRRSSKARAQDSPTTASWPAHGHRHPRRTQSMHNHHHRQELRKSMSAPGSPDPRSSVADLRVGSVPLSEHAIEDVLGRRDDPEPESPTTESAMPTTVPTTTVTTPPPPTKTKTTTTTTTATTTTTTTLPTTTANTTNGRPRSSSPPRPASSRNQPSYHRGSQHKMRRSGSGSSQSSMSDSWPARGSSGNLLAGAGVLPSSKWRLLKHLGLPDNSMTTIPAASLAPLSEALQSLDLSSNLFTQIPESLATLTALRALNLSHCMIDSLHSLTRNPLPAITALNLRANRLRSIAGIERLLPLERLDLRDNRIGDPSELARLTGIPDIREIWVEGNPFTRTHRNYRVVIFNLFRRTPGYTDDLVIDGAGPGYSERRQLVDRVPEPAAVPVVKLPEAAVPAAVDVNGSKPTGLAGDGTAEREALASRKERPVPKPVGSGSSRRRKTPKRRIVDLATLDHGPVAAGLADAENHYRISSNGSPQTGPPDAVFDSTTTDTLGTAKAANTAPATTKASKSTKSTKFTSKPLPLLPSEAPRIDSHLVSELPPAYSPDSEGEPWKISQDWDVGGELYRRKIEALRDKVGPGYLSVLGEENWASPKAAEYPALDSPIRAATPAACPASAQIHSGRTLG